VSTENDEVGLCVLEILGLITVLRFVPRCPNAHHGCMLGPGPAEVAPPRGHAMPRGHIETYHQGHKWHNRIDGVEEPFSDHFTSGDARLRGREEATRLKVDHMVRNISGQILAYARYRDGAVVDAGGADVPVQPRLPVAIPPGQEPTASVPPKLGLPMPVSQTEVRRSDTSRPQPRLDPQARCVLRKVNKEMQGMPTGAILWALVHRMPPSLRETGPSMRQLASFATAIHAGTFRG